MENHPFLFAPGTWLGQGTVAFTISPEEVNFYTKWIIEAADEEGKIRCEQLVEMEGVDEKVVNYYTIVEKENGKFSILLENDQLDQVAGVGIVDGTRIAWEFRQQGAFEGYELFEKNGDNEYLFHAEFASPDQFRTVIEGKIWLT